MKLPLLFLIFVSLSGHNHHLSPGGAVASDEHADIGHDEDVHPNTLRETAGEVFDGNVQTSRDVTDSDTNWDAKKDYVDTGWHPPTFDPNIRHVPPDLHPLKQDTANLKISNRTASSSQCGEYSGHVTSNGQCRLTATLPPAGTLQNRCPDVFRCTEEVSHWLQENQDRKQQMEELRETMSDLQEELRIHRHRVMVLEMQNERANALNSTFDQSLHSLERHQSKSATLLHIHTALLFELQAQLRNLTAAVRRAARHKAYKVRAAKGSPPSSMRDTLPPGGHFQSLCPSDCASLYHHGVRRSGVYTIVLSSAATLLVYCDMETEGGGWTVFQRRRDGLVSFNRGWSEYSDGFGDLQGEHWLGNQHLYLLSNQGRYSLRIDLQDWGNTHRHAHYHTFSTESEENHYRLHVAGFSGTLEDSFGWYHDQRRFSTPDTGNVCAEISHSGWWFHQCFYSNLNGVYYTGGRYSMKVQNLLGPDGIVWFSWKNSDFYSLKSVTMMIRPHSFRTLRMSP